MRARIFEWLRSCFAGYRVAPVACVPQPAVPKTIAPVKVPPPKAPPIKIGGPKERPKPAAHKPAVKAMAPKPPVARVAPVAPPAAISAAVKRSSAVEVLQQFPNLSPEELARRAGVTLSYARNLVRRRQEKTVSPMVRSLPFEGAIPVLQGQMHELPRRIEAPRAYASQAAVLERGAAGVPVRAMAEEFSMPEGEVEFILKMGRMKNNIKH